MNNGPTLTGAKPVIYFFFFFSFYFVWNQLKIYFDAIKIIFKCKYWMKSQDSEVKMQHVNERKVGSKWKSIPQYTQTIIFIILFMNEMC